MRKKAGIVCVALLVMLFAFSSCTQIVWVPVPDGPGISGSGKLDPEELMRQADLDKLYEDAAAVVAGKNVTGMELVSIVPSTNSSSSISMLSSRTVNRSYEAILRFTGGYISGSVSITDGEIAFTFTGSYDDSSKVTTVETYTLRTLSSLSFEASGISYSVGISVPNPVEASLRISENNGDVSITGSVTITVPRGDSGSISVDNDTISTGDIGAADNRFAGGYGTEAEPYKVSNRTQFLNISELVSEDPAIYHYFILTDDIELGYDDILDMFAGQLDGDGHSISVVGPITYTSEQKPVETHTIRAFAGSARFYDFEFHTIGTKMFAYGDITQEGGIPESIVFEDVQTYGDLVASNNIAPFLVYLQATEISFINCTNNASMTGGAGNYCSPFAGYMVGYSDGRAPDLKRLTYSGCVNNGNFSMESVSFVLANGGNSGNYVRFWSTSDSPDEDKIILTIENCRNNGQMTGTKNAGWFVWNSQDPESASWEPMNQYVGSKVSGNAPRVVNLEGLALSGTIDDTGNVVLTTSYPSADTDGTLYDYVYQKSYYGRFFYDSDLSNFAGTLLTHRNVENPENAGKAKVDSTDLDILVINGNETFLEEPTGNWTYSVSVYDDTGALLGTATCSVK